MNYKTACACVIFLAFLFCAAGVAFGQGTDLGTIRGTVTDSTGAVIPDAMVTATDTLTNALRETKTNSQGNYEMFGLRPGTYRVVITAAGMSKKEITDVVLNGSDTVAADAVLKVSAAQESVVVSMEAPAAAAVCLPGWESLISGWIKQPGNCSRLILSMM